MLLNARANRHYICIQNVTLLSVRAGSNVSANVGTRTKVHIFFYNLGDKGACVSPGMLSLQHYCRPIRIICGRDDGLPVFTLTSETQKCAT